MSESLQSVGTNGEEIAKEFLIRKGYLWRDSNFRTRGGEIDLVMTEGETWIFVEVKNRRSNQYGQPEEAITPAKMKHMIRTALLYIKIKNIRDKMIRFDVVTIDEGGVRHYPDAFQAGNDFYY